MLTHNGLIYPITPRPISFEKADGRLLFPRHIACPFVFISRAICVLSNQAVGPFCSRPTPTQTRCQLSSSKQLSSNVYYNRGRESVGIAGVETIRAEVEGDLAAAAIEGMTAAALASLSPVDRLEQRLYLSPRHRRVLVTASEDGHTVAVGPRGVAIVGGAVGEAGPGSSTSVAHVLVASAAAMAVVIVGGHGGYEEK